MRNLHRSIVTFLIPMILLISDTFAQTSIAETLAAAQAEANDKEGPRHVPVRTFPIPTADVSPQMQKLIGAPYTPSFNYHPKDAAEWKAFEAKVSKLWASEILAMQDKFNVTVAPDTINGVKVYVVAPANLPERNKDLLLVHVHGGGYVFGSGIAAAGEAILMAGIGGYKVISIDYRMPPDFPYPAALDDAMTVWKELVKKKDPKKMAIFGTSTGGGLTLAMALRAKAEKLPLPAAMAPCTPWADLTDTGDSYHTNEWTDNVLVTWSGWLGDAARLYAGGRDLKDPYLSPIYGDFSGLPPALLITGTRDLFLSNTVRAHRKLLRAGVEAELHVFEGQSHGQFQVDPDAPETKEAYSTIGNFFDKHLAR